MKKRRVHIARLSEAELVWLYADTREQKYFGELYLRYLPLVYGICLYRTRDEGVSQAAVRELYVRLPEGLLAESEVGGSFRDWLYAKVTAYLEKEHAAQENDDVAVVVCNVLSDEGAAYAAILERDEKGNAADLIKNSSQLSKAQKVCVGMFFGGQLSFADIAEKTGYLIDNIREHIIIGIETLASTAARRSENMDAR